MFYQPPFIPKLMRKMKSTERVGCLCKTRATRNLCLTKRFNNRGLKKFLKANLTLPLILKWIPKEAMFFHKTGSRINLLLNIMIILVLIRTLTIIFQVRKLKLQRQTISFLVGANLYKFKKKPNKNTFPFH